MVGVKQEFMYLLFVRQSDGRRNGRLIILLRLDLHDLGKVHLRERELLLRLEDLAVDIDLTLQVRQYHYAACLHWKVHTRTRT